MTTGAPPRLTNAPGLCGPAVTICYFRDNGAAPDLIIRFFITLPPHLNSSRYTDMAR